MSTAMMREALAMTAPMIADRPMPPSPNTATVAPASTLAVLSTAPMPVVTPQPSRQTFRGGVLADLGHRDLGQHGVFEKVEVPM
jgi:hypothetical protein